MIVRSIVLISLLLSASWSASAQEVRPKPDAASDDAEGNSRPQVNPKDFTYSTEEVIELFLSRIRQNPNDDVSYQRLGEMYERRAELSGNLDDYAKAEAALRKSLELFPHGHRAKVSLAAVLCSRHKFTEGLKFAREALKRQPKDVDALATAGDALLETGEYAEAEATFKELHRLSQLPPVLSRLASVAELKGDTEDAVRLMRRAASDVLKAGGTAKDAGWFHARVGDILLAAGRVAEAETQYAAVPAGIDAYHDATAGLARIRAMQGRFDDAIDLYKKAIAIGPDPHMLAALGDLYIKTGRPEQSVPLFDQLLKITDKKSEYLRERANFLSNHDRDISAALALAEEDLSQRKDVFGYDTLAWALYKNGRAADAERAVLEALKLGTRDASLFYHAGMIYHRLGNRAKAKEFLARALHLNPNFSPLQCEIAKKTLEGLAGEESPAASPRD
jgi:tetratricopeptide (TPR) repeat protein